MVNFKFLLRATTQSPDTLPLQPNTQHNKHYNNNATYLNRKRAVLDWIADKVDSLIDPELDVYNLLVVV